VLIPESLQDKVSPVNPYLRKSQLWSEDFTAKLFCNVEFWIERLPKFVGFCDSAAI
jgi:hypothetical protein